jgi:hypothetical protein
MCRSPSASTTFAATTVTLQTVFTGRLLVGVSVNVVAGELESVNVFGVPAGHSSLNELVVACTDSLNVTEIVELSGTSVAPFVGVVLVTVGGTSGPMAMLFSADVHGRPGLYPRNLPVTLFAQ